MEFDPVGVVVKPSLTVFVQPMPGAVVDDQKDLLSTITADELLEESQETVAVEHFLEAIREACIVQRDCSEDVRRASPSEGVYPRLVPDSRPCLVECSVEPEAGFVFP